MTKSSKIFAAKRVAVAVAAVCASLSLPAVAADNKALLDLMLKKGVITQAEYEQFSEAAENESFKEKRLSDDVSKLNKIAEKSQGSGSVMKNGAGIESADGNFSVKLTGRVHYDYRFFDSGFLSGVNTGNSGQAKAADNFELRRARIGLAGTLYKDIDYLILTNILGSDANLVDEAYVNYTASPGLKFRAGKFKQPFNLEEIGTSSNNIDFMERSYVNQLAPAKKLGAMVFGVPVPGMTYAFSFYQNGVSQNAGTGAYENGGRLTVDVATLSGMKDTVVHLGVAGTKGNYENTLSSSQSKWLSIRDEIRGVDAYSITTPNISTSGAVANVRKDMTGLEMALAYGPFKMQGEYAEAKYRVSDSIAGTVAGSGKVTAQYLEAMYNLTGESWADAYKDGGFGTTKPKSNFSFSNGGTGALQIGLRYSGYDASDAAAGLGTKSGSNKGNTSTVGLNWFLNPNARVMLNYGYTKFDSAFTVAGKTADSERVISIRTQINF